MRNFPKILAGIMMSALLIASCSKSDPGPSLIGTWTFTGTITSGCTGTSSSQNGTQPCTSDCTYKFTSTTVSAAGTTINYTTSGNKMTLTYGGISVTYTYSLTATKLTITGTTDATMGCKSVFDFTR